MHRLRKLAIILIVVFITACMAKTYHDEMQSEVEALKVSDNKMEDRYSSKFEIFSNKIRKLSNKLQGFEKTLNQNRADTDVMLEDLRVEIQSLRGAIEENTHKLSMHEKGINKSTQDLDGRVSELESKFDIILTNLSKLQSILKGEEIPKKKKDIGSNDINDYDSIVKVLTVEKNFDLAASRLKKFLKKYPSSSLADNAQYWLAECYYAKGDYRLAEAEFQKLITKYPASEKRCGAILKQGFALVYLKQITKSKTLLRKVINQCPDTTEAKIAIEKLNSISGKKAPTKKRSR